MKHPVPQNKAAAGGFTLTELLVVITIIAVLVALIFPVIGKVRGKADETRCASNLRQIGAAINLYANDNDNRLPSPIGSGVSPTLVSTQTTSLVYKLQPYMDLPAPTTTPFHAEIFHCPGVRGALLGDQSDWTKVTSYVLYSNNDMPPEKRYLPDNTFSDSTDKSWPVGPWGRTNSNPAASGWMRTQLSMGIDKSKVDANGVEPSLSIIPALYETDGEYPPEGKAKWPWPVPVKAAHDNHINVLFFDWHVAPVPRGSYSPAKK